MKRHTLTLAAGALLLTACAEMGGPGGSAARSQVSLAVSTRPTAAGVAINAAETFNDGSGNTLMVDSAFVIVRKMRLRGGPASTCLPDSGDDGEQGDTVSVQDSTGVDHDSVGGVRIFADDGAGEGGACGEFKAGPLLVELPVSGGAQQQFTVGVDSGTYTSVLFQIHRPSGAADSAFLAAHPEYHGVSIRVAGHWNGAPFVFTTGVSTVQRVDFDPPLVVGSDPVTFTLMVDMSGWFKSDDGTLVDPVTALDDSTNAPLVHRNIERSFHVFRDDDHDGRDDHLEHHDH
ncbi:MAG: hypothetical protein ACHQXA_02345 [Gemmatimonadales bacterium]